MSLSHHLRVKLSFSPFEISEHTKSDCYRFKGPKSANIDEEKLFGAEIRLFRAPLEAAPAGSRAMPWREFGGAAGPGGGGERAFPRPLGRRRGASSSASLAEGALGSSGVPLLAATAAPPATLGGDRDRQRR